MNHDCDYASWFCTGCSGSFINWRVNEKKTVFHFDTFFLDLNFSAAATSNRRVRQRFGQRRGQTSPTRTEVRARSNLRRNRPTVPTMNRSSTARKEKMNLDEVTAQTRTNLAEMEVLPRSSQRRREKIVRAGSLRIKHSKRFTPNPIECSESRKYVRDVQISFFDKTFS